ncbi:MAG: hypothetical protein QXK12_03175 [Candidatus Nezhaarchaeales archaeon]
MKTSNVLTLISMLLLILSISMILGAIVAPTSDSRLSNTAFLILTVLAMIMLALSSLLSTYAKKKAASTVQRTISVIKCVKCNYQEERDFQVGDYVLKKVGSCTKCAGTLIVASIYLLSPKR